MIFFILYMIIASFSRVIIWVLALIIRLFLAFGFGFCLHFLLFNFLALLTFFSFFPLILDLPKFLFIFTYVDLILPHLIPFLLFKILLVFLELSVVLLVFLFAQLSEQLGGQFGQLHHRFSGVVLFQFGVDIRLELKKCAKWSLWWCWLLKHEDKIAYFFWITHSSQYFKLIIGQFIFDIKMVAI